MVALDGLTAFGNGNCLLDSWNGNLYGIYLESDYLWNIEADGCHGQLHILWEWIVFSWYWMGNLYGILGMIISENFEADGYPWC